MVNNAGIFPGLHTILDESEEVFDSAMVVNAAAMKIFFRMLTARPREQSLLSSMTTLAVLQNI